jgi:hypothetical protein
MEQAYTMPEFLEFPGNMIGVYAKDNEDLLRALYQGTRDDMMKAGVLFSEVENRNKVTSEPNQKVEKSIIEFLSGFFKKLKA